MASPAGEISMVSVRLRPIRLLKTRTCRFEALYSKYGVAMRRDDEILLQFFSYMIRCGYS